jgi:hypothetical protein
VVVEVDLFGLVVAVGSVLLLLTGLSLLELLVGQHCRAVVVRVPSPAVVAIGILDFNLLYHFFDFDVVSIFVAMFGYGFGELLSLLLHLLC